MTNSTLKSATHRLLKPLARILIRYGIPFAEFGDVAKRAYVEVADKDFRLPKRKQTIARMAMLTGIQRKEVARLIAEDSDVTDPVDLSYSRGVRVISGWHRDSEFLDKSGEPSALPFDGSEGSFSALVKRYSGDLPARAVLDELQRVGSVQRDSTGLIHLTTQSGYIPSADKNAQFNIMGQSVTDLLNTLNHNLDAEGTETRMQLTTAYNNLSESAVQRFKILSRTQSLALLKQFDDWLAEHDRDANTELQDAEEGRYRAGIGIYYIEEQLEDNET
jgi:hypothetical protein